MMEVEVESALLAELAEFIGYIKSNGSVRAVVDAAEGGAGAAMRDEPFLSSLQVRRSEALRGKKEVLELDAAAVASSARRFLKALFVCCAEADRLTRAAVGERVLGGAAAEDDDMDVDGTQDDDMDVDGRPAAPAARHREEESGRVSAGSAVAAALFPSSGAKRKRACAAGGGGEADTAARPHKRRRLLAWWMRSHLWLPAGTGGRVSSARKVALARSRIRRPIGKPDARTVALAIQRRTGKPTMTRHRSKPSLGQHFSRISL